MIRFAAISLALLPSLAAAFEPSLPDGAVALGGEQSIGQYALPVGTFDGAGVPAELFDGRVVKRSWRVPGLTGSVSQLASQIVTQLSEQGYDVLFACETDVCGGFDFRFNTEVLPPPDMFVDLSEFRFVSAEKQGELGYEGVGVLVSETAISAMVQVIHVAPSEIEELEVTPPPVEEIAATPGKIDGSAVAVALDESGRAVLGDLTFETGSSRLGSGPFASLEALADWLKADDARRVVLVGHTDNEGALDRNIALSEARAGAVRAQLVEALGVSGAQVDARGVGYLAPIASNATKAGRETNRRVEVVVLP